MNGERGETSEPPCLNFPAKQSCSARKRQGKSLPAKSCIITANSKPKTICPYMSGPLKPRSSLYAPRCFHQSSSIAGRRSFLLCQQPVTFSKLAAPRSPTSQPPGPRKISIQRTAQVARHLSTTPSYASSSSAAVPMAPSQYTTRKVGAPNTLEHRIFIEKDGVPVSPFHDIPLYANAEQTILNMIVEVPRWTNAKMEVS